MKTIFQLSTKENGRRVNTVICHSHALKGSEIMKAETNLRKKHHVLSVTHFGQMLCNLSQVYIIFVSSALERKIIAQVITAHTLVRSVPTDINSLEIFCIYFNFKTNRSAAQQID